MISRRKMFGFLAAPLFAPLAAFFQKFVGWKATHKFCVLDARINAVRVAGKLHSITPFYIGIKVSGEGYIHTWKDQLRWYNVNVGVVNQKLVHLERERNKEISAKIDAKRGT